MSWQISVSGKTKTEAGQAFDIALGEVTEEDCAVRVHLQEAADSLLLGVPEDCTIGINTHGHLNPDGTGDVTFSMHSVFNPTKP